MGKRGRPRHPDVLTPREWEVLRLVRDGLSNEQIAERLAISLDGAKYHVSEILGKLGVDNRADAARWAEAPSRARAWAGVLAPLALLRRVRIGWVSGVAGAGVAAAVVAGLTLLVWALASEDGRATPAHLEGLTAQNFIVRVADAMDAPGKVLHVTSSRRGEVSGISIEWTIEAWIDRGRAESREVLDQNAEDPEIPAHRESIRVGRRAYVNNGGQTTGGGANDHCPGLTSFITYALPLICTDTAATLLPVPTIRMPTPVPMLDLDADYDGRPAISWSQQTADIISSDAAGNEVRTPIRTTFYVDRNTLFPIAHVYEDLQTRIADTYDVELIDRATLPDDFFDPASIGYVEG